MLPFYPTFTCYERNTASLFRATRRFFRDGARNILTEAAIVISFKQCSSATETECRGLCFYCYSYSSQNEYLAFSSLPMKVIKQDLLDTPLVPSDALILVSPTSLPRLGKLLPAIF